MLPLDRRLRSVPSPSRGLWPDSLITWSYRVNWLKAVNFGTFLHSKQEHFQIFISWVAANMAGLVKNPTRQESATPRTARERKQSELKPRSFPALMLGTFQSSVLQTKPLCRQVSKICIMMQMGYFCFNAANPEVLFSWEDIEVSLGLHLCRCW